MCPDSPTLTRQPLICKDGAPGYTSCTFPVTLIAQADNPGSSRGGGGVGSVRRRRLSPVGAIMCPSIVQISSHASGRCRCGWCQDLRGR